VIAPGKGEYMLIGIMDSAILNYCFRQYCQDHDLDIDYDPDAQRCAITAYSHYVQNRLTELYEVESDDSENG